MASSEVWATYTLPTEIYEARPKKTEHKNNFYLKGDISEAFIKAANTFKLQTPLYSYSC